MKRIQALLAAVLITGLVGLGMLAIGVNAALNTNTIPVSDSPQNVAVAASEIDPQAQTQAASSLIAQYQDREKQYQAQLNQATAKIQQLNSLVTQYQTREKQYQTQLNQANQQNQQFQSILTELQRRGIIRIASDGTIQLRGGN